MRQASPQGDAVARDKINTNNYNNTYYSDRKTQIDGWIEKLTHEYQNNVKVQTFVDNLQYYFQIHEYDEYIGLESKLIRAGRTHQKMQALRKKEAFSKLLLDWKSYPSAQEIIAYFLAKIEACFESHIVPILDSGSIEEIDAAIKCHLVDPVLQEMGNGPFMLNNTNVSGMVYWLAEQCYIRWHK